MPYSDLFSNLSAPWPSLAASRVTVGGSEVSYADALAAVEILLLSSTSAIAPVLRAAGNPLAGCDYFGAARPYMAAARMAAKTGRIGAAGRHITKNAFAEAVQRELSAARAAELSAALSAFRNDERYAVAIACEAVSLRERAYAAGVRSSVRAAVSRAVAACGAQEGSFSCSSRTACGTGSCRFASPAHRVVSAVAAPGRFTRPANHVRAGEGFSETGAAGEVAAAGRPLAGVQVWDADAA